MILIFYQKIIQLEYQRTFQKMGNFFQHIQDKSIIVDQALLNCSSSKLRQYYSSYRSICQSFEISTIEYVQIFGSNKKSFQVWDTKQIGQINAIEMFCGLIVFSAAQYEEKVRFLFEIFDFNEEGFLSYPALVFMLTSICNATFKIYSLSKEISSTQIKQFLNEYFHDESQVNIKQFIRWSQHVEEFVEFFKIINRSFQQRVIKRNICSYHPTSNVDLAKGLQKNYKKKNQIKQFIRLAINSQRSYSNHILTKLYDNIQKVLDDEKETNDFNPKIQWVYGIKTHKMKDPLKYIIVPNKKAASHQLLYTIGTILCIFFPKLNKQKHYCQHITEISCFEVANNKKIVASAQIGLNDIPIIHIWELSTLANKLKLKMNHRNQITLLKFLKNDQLLLTISQKSQSPVIIVNVKTEEIILSTYIADMAIEILIQNSGFLVLGEKSINCFTQDNNSYQLQYNLLDDITSNNPIVGSCHTEQKQFLTVHKNGQIRRWGKNYNNSHIICHLNQIIVSMTKMLNKNVFILVGIEQIYGMEYENFGQTVNKWQIPIDKQLYSLNFIRCIQGQSQTFYILSQAGDLLLIGNFLPDLDNICSPSLKKFYTIFKLQDIHCGWFVESTNTLYMGGSHFLYTINEDERQLVSKLDFGSDILCLHASENTIVFATEKQHIIVLKKDTIWERTQIQDEIKDIKISYNHLIVATKSQIEIFPRTNDKYFERISKKIKLENYQPLHISFTDDHKKFIVMTTDMNLFKCDLQLKCKNLQLSSKCANSQYFETKYQDNHFTYPMLLSIKKSIFMTTNHYGQILFWNTPHHMLKLTESFSTLYGHSSPINSLLYSQDHFYSIGTTDNLAISWSCIKTYRDQQQDLQTNSNQDQGNTDEIDMIASMNQKYSYLGDLKQWFDESKYWNLFIPISNELKDNKIKIYPIDEQNNKQLTKIIKGIIYPTNRNMYEPLINEKQTFNIQQPKLTLKMDHIFGFQSQKIKKSLFYIHLYQSKSKTLKQKKPNKKAIIQKTVQIKNLNPNIQNQFNYTTCKLLPFDNIHENCRRNFLYFVDRIPIVSCATTKKQKYYYHHSNKITCIAVHPDKQIVGSCEMGDPYPIIHVWNINEMVAMKQIKTHHLKSVIRAQFSRDGERIVTMGGIPNILSIQICTWHNQQTIAFRLFQNQQIYDLQFNPYNNSEVTIVGKNLLQTLQISSNTFIIKQQAIITDEDILSLCYTSSIYGNTIQSDVLTGNSIGNIGLFICGKYILTKPNAHSGPITILRMAQLFRYKTVLISGGQDYAINIWDTKFNKISSIYITQLLSNFLPQQISEFSQINLKKINVSPQSIDVYHCCSENMESIDTILLIGTRNGTIFQTKITNQYQGLKIFNKENKNCQAMETKQKITQNMNIQYLNHPSFGAVYFDIYAPMNIMITYNRYDPMLMIWNVEKQEVIKYKWLNAVPKTLKFSNQGLLAVGYIGGKIQICKIKSDGMIEIIQEFSQRQMDPISISFSQKDIKLAISFTMANKNKQSQSIKGSKIQTINSTLFATKMDNFSINTKITGTSNISITNFVAIYELQKNSQIGKVNYELSKKIVSTQEKNKLNEVVWMEFSTNYNSNKILLCYHHPDESKLSNIPGCSNPSNSAINFASTIPQKFSKIVRKDQEDSFVLWNISKGIEQSITDEQFISLNFSGRIKTKYHFYNDLQNKDNEKKELIEIKEPFICEMNQYDKYTLLGTVYGEIVILKTQWFYHNLFSEQMTEVEHSKKGTIRSTNSLNLDQYDFEFLTKCYNSFDNPINKMIVSEDNLYISSKNNHGIYKYTLISETFKQQQKRVDNISSKKIQFAKQINRDRTTNDLIENITGQYLQNKVTNIYSKRKYVYECKILQHQQKLENLLEENSSKIAEENSKMGSVMKKHSIDKSSINMCKNSQGSLEKSDIISQDEADENEEQKMMFVNSYEKKNNSNQTGLLNPSELMPEVKAVSKIQLSLELSIIIGRNALYKRNNIFIDLKQNIISYTGCNMLILVRQQSSTQKHSKVKQKFLKVDNSPFSTNPQIGGMAICANKKTVIVGTNEENCKIILWDISTKTCLNSISLHNIIEIILVKISDSAQHGIALGINRDQYPILMFLELKNMQILACHRFKSILHSNNKINDISFFPFNQYSFISCGNKHMVQWKYQGGMLLYQNYNLHNPKDFIELTQKNQSNKQNSIIFYSIIFVKDVPITAGSDGYLYLWGDKKIVKKQNAHPSSSILSLYSSRNSKIFASGAVDGKAIIWQMGSSSVIQKVFEFSIYSGKDIPTKYHIQSLCIGKNEIIIGTRSGQVYQFTCNSDEFSQQNYSQKNKQSSHLLLSAFDNDLVNSCSFNTSSEKLFVLTQSGIFTVFNLIGSNIQKIKQDKIDIGNSEIVKMLACKYNAKIFIVMKNSILTYQYNFEKETKLNKFRKSKQFLKSSSDIKNAILSLDQKYMALLIAGDEVQNAKIEVYYLKNDPNTNFYTLYFIRDSIPSQIDIIDFSTDNNYLMFKNVDEEETVIDLTTKKPISPSTIQLELQWNQQAKKTSKNIRDICSAYSDDNRLLRIVQIINHSIVATDEMGSLRVFKYPLRIDDKQLTYQKFYLQHLNEVFLSILSSDSKILVTVGRIDRSILIWKVILKNHNEQQNKYPQRGRSKILLPIDLPNKYEK